MVISCNSIGDTSVEAAVIVTSVSVSLTSVPNAAVMPLSAALTHGSRMPSTPAAELAAPDADADGVGAAVDESSEEPQPATPTRRAAAAAASRPAGRRTPTVVRDMKGSSVDGCVNVLVERDKRKVPA